MLKRQIELLAAAARVARFHNTPTLTRQTVGEHTFVVAYLVMVLSEHLPTEQRLKLLRAALLHDMPEAATGDIPTPAKRAMSDAGRAELDLYEDKVLQWAGIQLPYLSPEEKRVIKLADVLDGIMRSKLEVALGNTHGHNIGHKFATYLREMAPYSDQERAVIEAVAHYEGQYFDTEGI